MIRRPVILLLAFLIACGASSRQKTIQATLDATNVASASFVAYDNAHQQDIVAHAGNRAEAESQLAAWRTNQTMVLVLFSAAYKAIATAATVNDDPSLATMVHAAADLSKTLHDLGVIK